MPSSPRHLDTPVDDVVERVCAGRSDSDELERVAALLRAVQHARDETRRRAVRTAFSAPEPDAVLDELRAVLASANYVEVPHEVLLRALGESAVSRVRVVADLDAFADLVFFRRRTVACSAAVGRYRGWRRREVVRFDTYDRVAMYARVQDAAWFRAHARALDELPMEPGSTHVKLFQDVPEPDLEMLVPGIEVTMRTVDKVLLGVPALISGIVVAVTKLGAALVLAALLVAASVGLRDERPEIDTGTLVTLLGGAIALGGYLWRQWSKIRTRRAHYLRRLSESLYVKTIADGPRVLVALLDAAEEQDLAESLLAYRALLDGPAGLDEVARRAGELLGAGEHVQVDEALGHLTALGLTTPVASGWHALPPEAAVRVLRARWDDIGDALAGTSAG